jgi:hypothetical protein
MTRWIRIIALAVLLAAGYSFAGASRDSGAKEPGFPIPLLPGVDHADPGDPHEPTPPVLLNPDPKHPAGRLIEISIKRQTLTAWRNGRVVYRFIISTGRKGYETPKGHYRILEKYENRWSRKWSVWMPYAMRWYQGYFIHQLPHKDGSSYNIGASKLGTPDSHGCIRVDVGDASTLFRWTKVGTPVWVH